VHLAEAVGGQGFGSSSWPIVVAEFGYGAVPGPFVPSAIASALIAAHDPDAALLADLASGAAIAAYAIDSGLTATRQGDALVIRGEVRRGRRRAGVGAGAAGRDRVRRAVGGARRRQPGDRAGAERRPAAAGRNVRANAVEIGDDRVLTNLSRGHARALMSRCCRPRPSGSPGGPPTPPPGYAKIREQFGRPIGQFQAIKHKCAQMIAVTERATGAGGTPPRPAMRRRGETPETDNPDVLFAAAVAATLAPVAAQHCAQDCIQVHGGIGFTWEHDTNVYYRRALALAARSAVPRTTRSGLSTPHHHRDAGLTSTSIPRPRSCAPRSARKSALKEIPRRSATPPSPRRLGPAAPARPWGRAASPIEQIIIAQEFSTGRVRRPNMGIAAWIIPSIVAFGTDEQKQRFLPPTFRGEMIWCQLFSNRARVGPGQPDHQGHQGRRRMADHRPEDLDHRRPAFQWGALLARTDPSARNTMASPTSCST
jgi:alkylation response protein AidB-like acyl-CoA dehydrogenase